MSSFLSRLMPRPSRRLEIVLGETETSLVLLDGSVAYRRRIRWTGGPYPHDREATLIARGGKGRSVQLVVARGRGRKSVDLFEIEHEADRPGVVILEDGVLLRHIAGIASKGLPVHIATATQRAPDVAGVEQGSAATDVAGSARTDPGAHGLGTGTDPSKEMDAAEPLPPMTRTETQGKAALMDRLRSLVRKAAPPTAEQPTQALDHRHDQTPTTTATLTTRTASGQTWLTGLLNRKPKPSEVSEEIQADTSKATDAAPAPDGGLPVATIPTVAQKRWTALFRTKSDPSADNADRSDATPPPPPLEAGMEPRGAGPKPLMERVRTLFRRPTKATSLAMPAQWEPRPVEVEDAIVLRDESPREPQGERAGTADEATVIDMAVFEALTPPPTTRTAATEEDPFAEESAPAPQVSPRSADADPDRISRDGDGEPVFRARSAPTNQG